MKISTFIKALPASTLTQKPLKTTTATAVATMHSASSMTRVGVQPDPTPYFGSSAWSISTRADGAVVAKNTANRLRYGAFAIPVTLVPPTNATGAYQTIVRVGDPAFALEWKVTPFSFDVYNHVEVAFGNRSVWVDDTALLPGYPVIAALRPITEWAAVDGFDNLPGTTQTLRFISAQVTLEAGYRPLPFMTVTAPWNALPTSSATPTMTSEPSAAPGLSTAEFGVAWGVGSWAFVGLAMFSTMGGLRYLELRRQDESTQDFELNDLQSASHLDV